MKQCPKCQQRVEAASMNFCRADGALLVNDSFSEPATLLRNVGPSLPKTTRALTEPTSSLAVLPFRNLTADPADDYFCVGFAEELVHTLSRIESLRVVAPNSAFALKDKDLDAFAIGRTLMVEAVLEGSVRRSQSKMRITVQLVSTKTGYHVWSERYDRDVNQTFDLRGDIALAVLTALEVRLRGRERVAVRKRYTENAKAHQLYLRGRFYAGRFTTEGFSRGVECLNQAIAEDPYYALAYAGLAEAYHHASSIRLRPAESLMQVKAAAEIALELDKDLAEAQTLLAVVTANYDRLPQQAERGFQRALALAPNSVLAHQAYGCYLMAQGRLGAAIGELCQARTLDPLSPLLSVLTSITYFFAREPHHALRHARKAIAIDESFWLGYWSAALAHEQFGQLIEALGQLEKAGDRESSPWINPLRARVYAKLGKREIARAILSEATQKAGVEWVAPYLVATAYFTLGETDRGFEWLEKAFDEYDENLNFIAVDPVLDSQRSDPRFIDLLDRAGLEQSFAKTHFVVPVSGDCRAAARL
jgi:TolB-like protein